MATPQQSLSDYIDQAPLGRLQLLAVALCCGINLLDGFDIQAIAYAAPQIRAAWEIEASALGILLSAGFVGMAAGAVVMGPVSDRVGRKPTILFCVALLGSSTLASGFSTSYEQLLFFRVLTGVGIGGVLPSLNTLVAEYAPHRHRNLMVSLMHLGYPIGAIVGGLLARWLLPVYGWPSLFVIGGLLPLLLLPVVGWLLPESLIWLAGRPDDRSRKRLANVLVRLNFSGTLPAHEGPSPADGPTVATTNSVGALFRQVHPANTLLLWSAFFMGYLAIYFLMSWLPTILVDAGHSLKEGINAGIIVSLGGALGMLVLAQWSTRGHPGRRIGLFFVGATFGMIGIGQLANSSTGLLVMGFICGFLGVGAQIGLYTYTARIYPASIRATGTGWAIGIGRFGAILGPALGGVLIAFGWATPHYFLLLALPFAAAGLAVSLINTGREPRSAPNQ